MTYVTWKCPRLFKTIARSCPSRTSLDFDGERAMKKESCLTADCYQFESQGRCCISVQEGGTNLENYFLWKLPPAAQSIVSTCPRWTSLDFDGERAVQSKDFFNSRLLSIRELRSLRRKRSKGWKQICEMFTWKFPPAARSIPCIRLYRTSLDFVGELLMTYLRREHAEIAINFIADSECR